MSFKYLRYLSQADKPALAKETLSPLNRDAINNKIFFLLVGQNQISTAGDFWGLNTNANVKYNALIVTIKNPSSKTVAQDGHYGWYL